jgi:hypothetical protein
MRDEEIDRLFRESIENLDGLPPQAPHVDLEMAFQKIQRQLHGGGGTSQKKNFPGIFDLAAAMVALLLTLGYGINHVLDRNEPAGQSGPAEVAAVSPQETKAATLEALQFTTLAVAPAMIEYQPEGFNAIASEPLQLPEAPKAHPAETPVLQPVKKTKPPHEVLPARVSFAVEHSLVQAFKAAQKGQQPSGVGELPSKHHLSLQVPVGLAFANGHGAATLGTRLQWETGQPDKRMATTIQVGASAYAWATGLEGEGQPALSPQVFLEVSAGKMARQKGKWISGHEVGMGYRVAGQRDFMGAQLIKVNYTLHVKDRIQVSPEVMVSELSLQSGAVYPGIRVTMI